MGDFKIVKLVDPINITNIPGGLVPRGAYDNGTDYAVGDSVDYQGSSYVMFVDAGAGTLPTDITYWQVLAEKGTSVDTTNFTNLQESQGDQGDCGFQAWTSGTNANTYTIVDGKFQLDRSGYGFINNVKISWVAGQQTQVLSANTNSWIYIDTDGLLKESSSYVPTKIMLYEVLFDGTSYFTVKENHAYAFDSSVSGYLHNTVGIGTTIRNLTGADITRVSTGTGDVASDREIKIVGGNYLDDHGLATVIPDSNGNPISISFFYQNSFNQWINYATQTGFPLFYNNSGTPTALDGSNSYCVYTVYVSKDDIENSTPLYVATMDDQVYTTISLAQQAIINGGVSYESGELAALELAQLGYVIVQYSESGGFLGYVLIAKANVGAQLIGGKPGNDHALQRHLDYVDSGHTGFLPSTSFVGLNTIIMSATPPDPSPYTLWIDIS